ncbi:MAG TPA: DNA-directed RNA polymerase subunit omega [Blastocatellia bacterium]|nr:DNA-directed RNA polymerase subunit omega [Blastocatellia bacterium]
MKESIIENKYCKVIAAAQRARQIQKGARTRLQMPGVRATRIALEEIEQGLISFSFKPEEK